MFGAMGTSSSMHLNAKLVRILNFHPGATDAKKFVGTSSPLVNVSVVLDLSSQQARISLTGPTSVWFGVGLSVGRTSL